MSKIVKVEQGTGYTKKGVPIPIYRIRMYKMTDKEYAAELAKKEEFIKAKAAKRLECFPQKGFKDERINSGS